MLCLAPELEVRNGLGLEASKEHREGKERIEREGEKERFCSAERETGLGRGTHVEEKALKKGRATQNDGLKFLVMSHVKSLLTPCQKRKKAHMVQATFSQHCIDGLVSEEFNSAFLARLDTQGLLNSFHGPDLLLCRRTGNKYG